MTEQTKAYLYTLTAICYLASVAAFLAYKGKYAEALGFGGLTTGLIGLARTPSRGSVTLDNTPANPVPTDDVKA